MRTLTLLLGLLLGGCATSAANTHDDGEVCEDGICPLPAELSGAPSLASRWVLEDMEGSKLDVDGALASGRRVAFVFWQTWCGSCRAEFPELIAAAKKHKGKIDFIGLISGPDDLIDDAEVRAVAKEYELSYPQVRDRDLVLTRCYEVTGTPTIVIVGEGAKTLYLDHHAPESWEDYTR